MAVSFNVVETNVGALSMNNDGTSVTLCRINAMTGVTRSDVVGFAPLFTAAIADNVTRLIPYTSESDRYTSQFVALLIKIVNATGASNATIEVGKDSTLREIVVTLKTPLSTDTVLLEIPRTSEAGFNIGGSPAAPTETSAIDTVARSGVNALSNSKADKSYVDEAFATKGSVLAKADLSYTEATYATKASVAAKADLAYTDATYATKASVTAKADLSYTDATYATKSSLSAKADTSYVDSQVAGRTTTAQVQALIANATGSYLTQAAADLRYSLQGHTHDYLSQAAGDLRYALKGASAGTVSVTASPTPVSGLTVTATDDGSGGVVIGLSGPITGFATSTHTHDYLTQVLADDRYALKGAVPSGALTGVTASAATVRGLGLTATPSGNSVTLALSGDITGFSEVGHLHDEYAIKSHTHPYALQSDLNSLDGRVSQLETGGGTSATVTIDRAPAYVNGLRVSVSKVADAYTLGLESDGTAYATVSYADDTYATKNALATLEGRVDTLGNATGGSANVTERVVSLETWRDSLPAFPAINPADYYTRTEVDGLLNLYQPLGSLDQYLTKDTADGYYVDWTTFNNAVLGEGATVNLDPYALKDDVARDYVAFADLPTTPDNLATLDNLDEYVQGAELANYALKSDVYTTLQADGKFALAADIPDVSGFVSAGTTALTNYYTKQQADTKFALIGSGGGSGSTQDLKLQRRLVGPFGVALGSTGETGIFYVTLSGRGGDLGQIVVQRELIETATYFALSVTNTIGSGLESIQVSTNGPKLSKILLLIQNPQGATLPYAFARPVVTCVKETGATTTAGNVYMTDASYAAVTTTPQATTYEYIRVESGTLTNTNAPINKMQFMMVQL